MHTLRFSAYCGMSWNIKSGSLDECRIAAAKVLRKRKREGHPIVKLESNKWECQEPEDCMMVPDTAGILVLDSEEEDMDDMDDMEDMEDNNE